ncbi:apolipoprotein C-IV [Gracilinanus agilis]|uniref:apolipoprotein C-IV n=1 Tax=Gracilinanus agilis TaxID=191870 RepID=UPI001CFCA29F|nr:apolipoprotein C-IV [Gracilinanus agilis]
MVFPRLTCPSGPSILLWVLVLAWATGGHGEDIPAGQHLEEGKQEGWKVSRFFWRTVEPLLTRATESWNWIRTPGPVRGYLQTYYEDHLSGLGLRAQNWLHTSREKVRSLCPTKFCGGS